MHSAAYAILAVYSLGMAFIFLYSIAQWNLLWHYPRRDSGLPNLPDSQDDWPEVLIQLPVYNERYVVERLIDAACALDYPAGKLHIQLLDDSTDESADIAARRVEYFRERGTDIVQIRRGNRTGFKAGALQYGLQLSRAPFVAIFDADFLPEPDYLKKTIPQFAHKRTGVVQTRWEHLNRNYSLLTRAQALALDGHFTVEQVGRNRAGYFINFNGTAGVWRRACIDDAGGWRADTLTEDLDLSYRAQLRGWYFVYNEGVAVPAELPIDMGSLKAQQYRWNKGAAECAFKHLGAVLRSPKMSLAAKCQACFHLLNSSVFVWIVVCAVLSLPLMHIKYTHPDFHRLFYPGVALFGSFLIFTTLYYTAFRRTCPGVPSGQFLWQYPLFLSLSMGMSLHNASAALQGYARRRTPFVRTPKWNIIGSVARKGKLYRVSAISPLTFAEGLLAIYFSAALVYGIMIAEWGFIPFHAMLAFGFSSVFVYSFRQ